MVPASNKLKIPLCSMDQIQNNKIFESRFAFIPNSSVDLKSSAKSMESKRYEM